MECIKLKVPNRNVRLKKTQNLIYCEDRRITEPEDKTMEITESEQETHFF